MCIRDRCGISRRLAVCTRQLAFHPVRSRAAFCVWGGLVIIPVGTAADGTGDGIHLRQANRSLLRPLHRHLDYSGILIRGIAVSAEAEIPEAVENHAVMIGLYGLQEMCIRDSPYREPEEPVPLCH